jgi:hypothetical protein
MNPLHLQPAALHAHLHAIPPGLQSLDGIPPEANDAFFQAQQRYGERYLGGPGQFESHAGGLQQVGGQQAFPPFPGAYPRTFQLDAPPPPQQHIQAPPPQVRQQVQLQQVQQVQQSPIQRVQQQIQLPHQQQPPQQIQQSPIQRLPQQIGELEARHEFLQPQQQAPAQIPVPEVDDAPVTNHGQFEGLRLIPDPPDLDLWREKLFHVDDTITLTEDEYVHGLIS